MLKMRWAHIVCLILSSIAVVQASDKFVVRHLESNEEIVLENGYAKIVFDKSAGVISSIASDFHGQGQYSSSILSSPFGLEIRSGANSSCTSKKSPNLSIEWRLSTGDIHSFVASGIVDCATNPLVEETWTVSLATNSRFFDVDVSGRALRNGRVEAVTHSLYLNTLSLYGLFDRGVTQMMANQGSCLGSNQSLPYAYFVGNGFGLDFVRKNAPTASQTVLLSAGGTKYNSGFQEVLIGEYPNLSLKMTTAWDTCWRRASTTSVTGTEKWSRSYSIAANNFDFPVASLPTNADANNLPFEDLQTYLMGIYASPVGCLQSYFEGQDGTIAPTVSHPDVGYSPDTNFFDPDNFITLSAMLYSGDAYLVQQVKSVIERTGETMCGIGSNQLKSYCDIPRQRITHKPMKVKRFHGSNAASAERTGQLMHHFVSLVPTYESIAGSEQLGPNIFWTWTLIRYLSLTQDKEFATKMFPYVDLSTKFLITFFDENMDLLFAPGPLWIDVLVRENYTSDSAPIFVPLLNQIADLYDYLSIDAEFSSFLRGLTVRLASGINAHLWSTENDHYITQLNPDGTIRDFIDYDANLLTVAFDIAPAERAKALLNRVDNGEHTHIRATWCSEIPYSGDAEDCYIVGGTVCGDSIVTLARIGWVDALARKKIGDLQTFENLLLKPLQKDLVRDVWLYERYDANGNQIRTSFYFEYPALVTMMLREVRYGVELGLNSVTIAPFPALPFTYALGAMRVQYSSSTVSVSLPGASGIASNKAVEIAGLQSQSVYNVHGTNCSNEDLKVSTDDSGSLRFLWTFYSGCEVVVSIVV